MFIYANAGVESQKRFNVDNVHTYVRNTLNLLVSGTLDLSAGFIAGIKNNYTWYLYIDAVCVRLRMRTKHLHQCVKCDSIVKYPHLIPPSPLTLIGH